MFNGHHSEETKLKIGNANRGKIRSQEVKDRMSEAHKHCYPEHLREFWNNPKYKGQKRPEISARQLGDKNPNWKGGRTTLRGYIKVKSPGHPRAVKGYVYEHRLIVENHIGRYLTPTEVPHHINGVRSDNRLENLYLFPTPNEHNRHEGLKEKPELVSNLEDFIHTIPYS